jgi:hypothetical protein
MSMVNTCSIKKHSRATHCFAVKILMEASKINLLREQISIILCMVEVASLYLNILQTMRNCTLLIQIREQILMVITKIMKIIR